MRGASQISGGVRNARCTTSGLVIMMVTSGRPSIVNGFRHRLIDTAMNWTIGEKKKSSPLIPYKLKHHLSQKPTYFHSRTA